MVASGPKEGRISGSLPLTCTITGAPLDSPRYDWNSVRQTPRGELQFLGWIYPFGNNTGYAPPFQGRVTISADKDKNKVSLQLRNLTASDTATYFCARQHTVMLTEGEAAQKGGGLLGGVTVSKCHSPVFALRTLSEVWNHEVMELLVYPWAETLQKI